MISQSAASGRAPRVCFTAGFSPLDGTTPRVLAPPSAHSSRGVAGAACPALPVGGIAGDRFLFVGEDDSVLPSPRWLTRRGRTGSSAPTHGCRFHTPFNPPWAGIAPSSGPAGPPLAHVAASGSQARWAMATGPLPGFALALSAAGGASGTAPQGEGGAVFCCRSPFIRPGGFRYLGTGRRVVGPYGGVVAVCHSSGPGDSRYLGGGRFVNRPYGVPGCLLRP